MREATKKLAEQIVKSWSGNHVNYIIIAPPMSGPENLFNLLGDTHYLKSVLGDLSSTFAIARLSRGNFRSEEIFVSALASKWQISRDGDLDPIDQLSYLTSEIKKSKRTPVLLIERFHEAMERLGEDFGTALRDLDKALRLTTIVELPVSLKMLKLRWETDPEKAPFLNSDWGQGHTEKVLKGYSRDEISNLVRERGGPKENADFLFAATGGLPELVDRLLGRVSELDRCSYEKWVRSQAKNWCDRLIKWLDYPGHFTYTRLVAQSLSMAYPHHGPTSLASHPWKDILQGTDGRTSCMLLAWASIDHLADERDAKYFALLTAAASQEEFRQEVMAQLGALAGGENLDRETFRALELLCRFQDAADPYSPDRWDIAAKHLSALRRLAEQTDNAQIRLSVDQLGEWDGVTKLMSEFLQAKRNKPTETLEQFVCRKADVTKVRAFLTLLNLRLTRACRLKPYHALKAVIEQPESIFQVYCTLKLEISSWDHSGLNEDDILEIRKVLGRSYDPPRKGRTLGFFDMLCLSLVKGRAVSQEERLVSDEKDLHSFETLYKNRSEKVHSTALVSLADWNEYLTYCTRLLEQVRKALVGSSHSIELPEPMDCFSRLAESLAPAIKHQY